MSGRELGLLGFAIGTVTGQFAGGWAYRVGKKKLALSEPGAAIGSGLATAVVASSLYILFHVHEWIGGNGGSWGVSVFIAMCMGIVQGALFRSRPLEPRA